MAVIKLGDSKSATNSINYFENKASVKSGLNCDIEIAKEQFKITRDLWGKSDGIQCHTVIQSFLPGEVTAEQANMIGLELAEKVAKGYEIAVYTHSDQNHIHNHIVINSVHPETGRKYHSDRNKLWEIRKANDEICLGRGLSLPSEKSTPAINYTLAEREILEKGKNSWKDDIRTAIELEILKADSFTAFKAQMQINHGIIVNDTKKHIVYTDSAGNKSRGKTLGASYTEQEVKNGIERRIAERGEEDRASNRLARHFVESGDGKAERQRILQEQAERNAEKRRRDEQNRIRNANAKPDIQPKSKRSTRGNVIGD